MISEIQEIGNVINSIFSIVANLFIIGLVIMAILFVIRVLADSTYSIRQINVPRFFEDSGLTGPVIAKRIHDRLNEIIQHVSAAEYAKGYTTTMTESDVSIDVAGMGMPIKGFIELIGSSFGIQRKKKIDADIFIESLQMIMVLRISGEHPERFEVPMNENLGIPLKVLVALSSEAILKYSNDEALQTFFGHIERNGEKAIRLARYRLEKNKDKGYKEARIVSAWARGHSLLKQYDAAEEKLKKGIKLNANEGRLYNVWGLMLQEQGNHEEAKVKLMKAINLMSAKESRFRRSNVLTAIGQSFSKLGNSDTAINYYYQAIKVDGNAHASYFHLSKEYLLSKNDRVSFFETLEKSLANGLSPLFVSGDSDFETVCEDKQFKNLLEKYKEN